MVAKPNHALCWCPACDQGWVMPVLLRPIDLSGRLCTECEAFWYPQEMIAEEWFTQLSTLVKEHKTEITQITIEIDERIV